jgi:signal transduction histidine kinase
MIKIFNFIITTKQKQFLHAMNNIRPASDQVKNSFQQLIFLVSPSAKKILFSNRPFDINNEKTNAFEKPPFLKMTDPAETERITEEWKNCLQLQENQSHNFSCKTKAGNARQTGGQEDFVWVHFQATGVKMAEEPAICILFLATQKEMDVNPVLKNLEKKIEQLDTTFNNYKKEYNEFIDIAAHDLDAPLRKLSVLIERLTGKFKNALTGNDIHEYITRINTSLDNMRSLIDGLALLSQIISDKKEYNSCNIEVIVQQTLADLQPIIKEKKAVITTSTLPLIEGDAKQYSQLFKNLLDNAIKFSKEDTSLVIDIRSVNVTGEEKSYFNLQPERPYYKIEISDNGIGFKQDFAENIFRPFVRLHGNSRFAGSGLGLAICKKIVENHGGIIYAEGRENSGSCFALILPQTP